jgi:diacylglycerol kinase
MLPDEPGKPPETGLAKFLAGFAYAVQGLVYAIRTQCNVRVHLVIAAIALTAALALKMPRLEIIMVLLLIALVLAAELFNTAIETCVDLAAPDYHTLAKTAKDVSAAAVLICAIVAVVIGAMLYGPALWRALEL